MPKFLCSLWLGGCAVAWGMPVVLDESHAAAFGAVVKYMEAQRRPARQLARNGVDIVLGSHPHVWQEPFTIGLTRVYPSLGNWRFYPVSPAFDTRPHILLHLGHEHRRSREGLWREP